MRIEIFYDPEELLDEAADALHALFERYKKTPVLFLSSGGSALTLLRKKDIHDDCLGEWVTMGVLDERVTDDDRCRNFIQLFRTPFFHKAQMLGCHSIDPMGGGEETLEGVRDRVEHAFRTWKEEHPEGVIIATVGIGEDGHTAGILPYQDNAPLFRKLFFTNSRWVVGYETDRSHIPIRITVTIPFLRDMVTHAIGVVAGERKREAFDKLTAKDGMLHETPAHIWWKMKDIHVFTNVNR